MKSQTLADKKAPLIDEPDLIRFIDRYVEGIKELNVSAEDALLEVKLHALRIATQRSGLSMERRLEMYNVLRQMHALLKPLIYTDVFMQNFTEEFSALSADDKGALEAVHSVLYLAEAQIIREEA